MQSKVLIGISKTPPQNARHFQVTLSTTLFRAPAVRRGHSKVQLSLTTGATALLAVFCPCADAVMSVLCQCNAMSTHFTLCPHYLAQLFNACSGYTPYRSCESKCSPCFAPCFGRQTRAIAAAFYLLTEAEIVIGWLQLLL